MVIGNTIQTEGKKANEITAAVEQWIEDTIAELPDPYQS